MRIIHTDTTHNYAQETVGNAVYGVLQLIHTTVESICGPYPLNRISNIRHASSPSNIMIF